MWYHRVCNCRQYSFGLVRHISAVQHTRHLHIMHKIHAMLDAHKVLYVNHTLCYTHFSIVYQTIDHCTNSVKAHMLLLCT